MTEIRRDLHRHPELSWKELRTSDRIAEELIRLGLKPRRGIAGTGLYADLPGPKGVPLVGLRADIDALPIHEDTGLPFSSENPGLMHACAHDGHTSILLGATALLLQEPELPAPVRVMFQPAEELGKGAVVMVKDGALDGVGVIFGAHIDRHYDTGILVVTEGPVNASTDRFEILVRGQDGHAARPHQCLDAVVIGSLIIIAMQTIVSREVDPAEPSVVSVGRFEAGTAHNVIAGRARLEGTIRAQSPKVRAHLGASIQRIGRAVGELHGARVEVIVEEGTKPLINSPEMAGLAHRAARAVVGSESVQPLRSANMGGEDFSEFLAHVPGAYLRIGARRADWDEAPAHSARFDFDEDALPIGAAFFRQLALDGGRWLRTCESS